jgi:hypothetical protein
MVVAFVLLMMVGWGGGRWMVWLGRRMVWLGWRMVWLGMVGLGVMDWLVVWLGVTMAVPVVLMNDDRGGSVWVVIVQGPVDRDHLVMVQGLLDMVGHWHQLFLHYRLDDGDRITVVRVLIVTLVVIIVIIVFIFHQRVGRHCCQPGGHQQGLGGQLGPQPLLVLLLPQGS